MPTFVLMTRLRPESVHDARGRREKGQGWLKKVQTLCPQVKWIAHYAILGPYDFINILEAPTNEVVSRVAIELGSRGTLQPTTMAAMRLDDFIKNLK